MQDADNSTLHGQTVVCSNNGTIKEKGKTYIVEPFNTKSNPVNEETNPSNSTFNIVKLNVQSCWHRVDTNTESCFYTDLHQIWLRNADERFSAW